MLAPADLDRPEATAPAAPRANPPLSRLRRETRVPGTGPGLRFRSSWATCGSPRRRSWPRRAAAWTHHDARRGGAVGPS